MLLEFLGACQKGLVAVGRNSARIADAVLFAHVVAACSELLECVIHVGGAPSPSASSTKQSKKGGHANQKKAKGSQPMEPRDDFVGDEDDLVVFCEEAASVLQRGTTFADALKDVAVLTFRPEDASFPSDVTRAALRWVSLCGGVMHSLVSKDRRDSQSLAPLTNMLLTGLVVGDAPPTQPAPHRHPWSLLMLAALGATPSVNGRVAIQWNVVHHGAGDVGSNLLFYCAEVVLWMASRNHNTSAYSAMPQKLVRLARHIRDHSGSSGNAAVDRIVRHAGDRLCRIAKVIQATKNDGSDVKTSRREKRSQTQKAVSPIHVVAELVWGLVSVETQTDGGASTVAQLWHQHLRFNTVDVQRSATMFFEALSRDRGPADLVVLLRSLTTKSTLQFGPLAAWISSLPATPESFDDVASPLLDVIRQIVSQLVSSDGAQVQREAFSACASLLLDVTRVLQCPRSAVKRLVQTLADGMWQLRQANRTLSLTWPHADVLRAFEAVSGHAREEKMKRDQDVNVRRLLDTTRGHTVALEAALKFLQLCPPDAVLETPRLLNVCQSGARSPVAAVRRAAIEAQSGLPSPPGSASHKASTPQGPPSLQKFGVQLFHDVISDLSTPPTTADEIAQRVAPELLLATLHATSFPAVSSWSRSLLEAVSQECAADSWQQVTASFLASEVAMGVSRTSVRSQQRPTTRGEDVSRRGPQAQQDGALSMELLELCIAWVRERRWAAEAPRDQRSALCDANAIVVLMLSHLDMCTTSYNCDQLLEAPISSVTMQYLGRVLPPVRPHLAELAVVLAQTLHNSSRRDEALTTSLISTAVRLDITRLKDIRQLAVALLQEIQQDQQSNQPMHENNKRRGLVTHEMLRVCIRSAQVRLLWNAPETSPMLDGHLQGISALISRIIPELMRHQIAKSKPQGRSSKGEAMGKDVTESAASTAPLQLGGHLVSLFVNCIFPAVESYRERNFTTSLQHLGALTTALTGHAESTRVAAALVVFADASCSQLVIEIASGCLGHSEALDERDVLKWFSSLKDALQGALRCFKSDGLTSRELRDSLMDTGVITRDTLAAIQQTLMPRLPVELMDGDDVPSDNDDRKRWMFSDDKKTWVIKRRRTEILSIMSAAVSRAAARRIAFATVIGNSSELREREPAPVPDVCRGMLEFVFEDEPLGTDDNELNISASEEIKSVSWMKVAETLETAFRRARPTHATFLETLRELLHTDSASLLMARRSRLSMNLRDSGQHHDIVSQRGTLWIALTSKLCAVGSEQATDFDGEIEVCSGTLRAISTWALTASVDVGTHCEVRSALSYALLDWLRVSLVPVTRGDPARLAATLDVLRNAMELIMPSVAAARGEGRGALELILGFMQDIYAHLCPSSHQRLLLRHFAALSQQLAQRAKPNHPTALFDESTITKSALLLQPVLLYIARDDISREERSHWISRLLIRLGDMHPTTIHANVVAAVTASPQKWLSTVVVEVAVASLCRVVSICKSDAPLWGTTALFAKILALAIGSGGALRPNASFLVNSLRMSHASAFRCVSDHLNDSQRQALDRLDDYCNALESIASSPAELAAVTTSVIADDVESFANLFQEVLGEANALLADADQKAPSKGTRADEELPELGSEHRGHASIAAPVASGASLAHEALNILSDFTAWIQEHIRILKLKMSERVANGVATWFDKSMWFIEKSITDVVTTSLPSAHPEARGSAFLHAVNTAKDVAESAKAGLQRIVADTRNKGNASKMCSQLSELLTHTCQCIRQDVCNAFRRASHELRSFVDAHVIPWYQVPNTGAATAIAPTQRTIEELFGGQVPPILLGPIPVSFSTQGSNESVTWKLDLSTIELTKSQEFPRTIRFRGTKSTTAVPLGGSKASRKQIHFTQTFILKGCQANDSVARDHVLMTLLRELQQLQHHAAPSRDQHGLVIEQWLAARSLGTSAAQFTVFTPCFSIYPFARGGGLAEVLQGTNSVSSVVETWRTAMGEEIRKTTDDSRSNLPLSLSPPLVQFQETLKSVVDEHNMRQQEARSRLRSNPRERSAASDKPPHTNATLVDLNRPPPEIVRETYLRLLRAQPSSRECIANAIFAEIRYDGNIARRCVLPSDFAWVQRWSRFTRSFATGCALTYILGLGDRHLGNILVCSEEALRKGRSEPKKVSGSNVGMVAHVDFAVCFGAGAKLRFPERTPFRLSPIFMHPMGAYGSEGGFAEVLQQVLATVHQNESFVLEVTEALRWLVPLSGPVRRGSLSTVRVDSQNSGNGAYVLRGSMVAIIDRVAERVHRHLDALYGTLAASTQKHPNGQWMAIRQQIHLQCKFQAIAASGRRLAAITESSSLRTDSDVNTDITNATTQANRTKDHLLKAFEEFHDTVKSCQRVINRLREVTSQVACDSRHMFVALDHNTPLLEAALSTALSLPQSIRFPDQPSEVPSTQESSLWQVAAPLPNVGGTVAVKSPSSVCISAWEAYLPSMSQQSVGIASLLGGGAAGAKQRLLQRDSVTRQLVRLMDSLGEIPTCNQAALIETQKEIDELMQCARRRPTANNEVQSSGSLALQAGARLASDIDAWSQLPVVQSDETDRAVQICSNWFAAVRSVLGGSHSSSTDAANGFTEKLTERLLAAVVDEDIEVVAACRAAAVAAAAAAARPLADCSTTSSVPPFQFQSALLILIQGLNIDALTTEAAVSVVHAACAKETLIMVSALFCVDCLSHGQAQDIVETLSVWRHQFATHHPTTRALVLGALAEVAEGLTTLVTNPSLCSAAARTLGEVAGLPSTQVATDVLLRFDSIVDTITDELWPVVTQASTEVASLEKQLIELNSERSRIRQRSAVVYNEHRQLTDLLRQSLTPVTLNPLSMVVRQVQVSLEGLYKELHTDLAETVLPRLLQRAGSGGPSQNASSRSPMQLAAQLIQRSEQDAVNLLNMTHQLITEGYEELATLISRGASVIAQRRLTIEASNSQGDHNTLHADVEVAGHIERLLVVTDAMFVTVSVSMFTSMQRLFTLLGSFGSTTAGDRSVQIRTMLDHFQAMLEKIASASSNNSHELAASWGTSGGQHKRKVHHIERLAEQLLRPQLAVAEATGAGHDIRTAVVQGDSHTLIDDLKKRIRHVASDNRVPGRPHHCVAPPAIKFLIQSSIDADALSAMYPGWTAWI